MVAPRRRDRSLSSTDDERGSLRSFVALVHLVVVLALFVSLVAGVVHFGPPVVEQLQEEASSVGFEEPPPAGDREPATTASGDPGGSTYGASSDAFEAAVVEELVHEEVNDRRREHGLDPLEWDGTIASVSRAHSADMHRREYFDHTNPDGEGPMDRFEPVGGYCRAYGENLAMTWADRSVRRADGEVDRYETPAALAEGLVEQWMASPPHREAILEESWDRGGVGVHLTDDGQVFATHNFCRTP